MKNDVTIHWWEMVLGKNLSYANKGLKLQIEIIEGDFLSLEFMC